MAKFSFTIDTDLIGPLSVLGGPTILDSPNQVGLISSITLSPDMQAHFNIGLMGTPQAQPQQQVGYNAQNIKNQKDQLRANCKVIATAGGLVVLNALQNEPPQKMPPFVSLVGNVPPGGLPGNCKGGISLESINLNSMRKNYLKGLSGGNTYTDATICLYANPNSAMHPIETAAWGNNPIVLSNVAQANGVNNANNFAQDFNGGGANPPIPQNVNAIIISDDPFFQDNQPTLVPLINTWLGGGGGGPPRQVVYPHQNYPSVLPPQGQGAIVGPNLLQAYMLLGALAGSLLRNPNTTSPFGFVRLGSETIPL